MREKRDWTDEDLTALLDGVAHGDSDVPADARARAARLEQGRLAAMDGFGQALEIAPAMPTVLRKDPVLTGPRLAASVAFVAVLAGAVWLNRPTSEPWHQEVAAYHALYVTQTLSVVPDTDQAEALASLSALVGRDLTPATSVPALDFKRAQRLGFDGEVLIQMAYLDAQGTPFAFCILRNSEGSEAPRALRLSGLEAVGWSDEGARYLIIGGQDAAQVRQLADDLAVRMTQS